MYNGYPGYPASPMMPYPSIGSDWGQTPRQESGANDIEGVRWVSCRQEVDGTSMRFGTKALFMSTTEDEFWIKGVGHDGVPTLRHFRYEEVLPPNPDDFVTRDEMQRQIEMAIARYREEAEDGKLDIQPAASASGNGFVADPAAHAEPGGADDAGVPRDA